MTDTPTTGDLVKRLRAQSDPAVRERTMEFWDSWRRAIKDGEIGSWPRDAFESLLDELADDAAQAADALEAAERERDMLMDREFIDRDGEPVVTSNAALQEILYLRDCRTEALRERCRLLAEVENAKQVIAELVRIAPSVGVDLCSAHSLRRADASEAMREEDIELRRDFDKTALSGQAWLARHGTGTRKGGDDE